MSGGKSDSTVEFHCGDEGGIKVQCAAALMQINNRLGSLDLKLSGQLAVVLATWSGVEIDQGDRQAQSCGLGGCGYARRSRTDDCQLDMLRHRPLPPC